MRSRSDLTWSHAKWLRGFCNRWTETSEPVFDLEEWAQLTNPEQVRPDRRDLVISYDVDQGVAAVVAAWTDRRTGRPQIRTVHRAPGTIWLPKLMQQISAWRPRAIIADDGGATRRVTAQLQKAGHEIETLGARDLATATDLLLTLARDRQLQHDGSTTLREGIAHVQLLRTGDARRFARNGASGVTAGIIAAAAALHRLDLGAAPIPKPLTRF